MLCLLFHCSAQQPDLRFYNFTSDKGLMDNATKSIIQDDSGLIWIATESGVDRFDGNAFKHYVNIPHDAASVDENVQCFLIDSDKEMWLGSVSGLQRYDYVNDNFQDIPFFNPEGEPHVATIVAVLQDEDHSIWAVSSNNGILKYNTYTEEKKVFVQDSADSLSLPVNGFSCAVLEGDSIWLASNDNGLLLFNIKDYSWSWVNTFHRQEDEALSDTIRCMFNDNDFLWLGSENNGLFKLNKKSLFVKQYKQEGKKAGTLQCDAIRSLNADNGILYIGSECGLEAFDMERGRFSSYRFDDSDLYSLNGNHVRDILIDADKHVWICTDQGGVSLIPSVRRNFHHKKIRRYRNNFRQNFVTSLLRDFNGDLWVGTDGAGLYVKKKGSSYHKRVDEAFGLGVISFLSMAIDKDSVIWLGSNNAGLLGYHLPTGELTVYANDPANHRSLNNNMVKDVFVDEDNNVWVATNGGGLQLLERGTMDFRSFEVDPGNRAKLASEYQTCIFQDSRKNIWTGSYWGLSLINPRTFTIRTFLNDAADDRSLNSNLIFSIDEDSEGRIWIGTRHGLNMFSYTDSSFVAYTEKDSLVNNVVHGVAVDRQDNVWVSTNYGLSRFNRIEKKFYNFDEYDGLQSDKFMQSVLKDGDRIYFGGVNGYNYFNIDDIQYNSIIPHLYITNIKVFNEDLIPCPDCPLKKNVIYANEIELHYKQNMLEIEFSAMDVVNPNKVMYKYMLEGFDRGWSMGNKKRIVNYSNLPPGEYIFRVKASNSDRVWGANERKIRITIRPPFWQTLPFYSLFFILIGVFLYILIRFRERRLFQDKVKLEKLVLKRTEEIEMMNEEMQLQNQELKELNSTKDRFFSIIAHDLKNPMNALLGFSQVLFDRYASLPDEKRVKMVKMLNESSMLMFDLLNNLLDWSRSQTGSLKFSPYSCSPARMIKDNIALVKQLAANKDITITTDIYSPKSAFADSNMLNTVIRNILTNSIKFTPRGGNVYIEVNDEDADFISISIKDTGVGMTEDQIVSLFKIDSHRSTSGTENENGTGLGLIVCKEFVEKNGGRLRVSSKPSIGSIFSFTVPVFK